MDGIEKYLIYFIPGLLCKSKKFFFFKKKKKKKFLLLLFIYSMYSLEFYFLLKVRNMGIADCLTLTL